MFLAADGDDVGARLERLIILGQKQELQEYGTAVEVAMTKLKEGLAVIAGDIIFWGGDSILAEVDENRIPRPLESVFQELRPITFSVGTGATMREAYVALKMAKASGKNCWVDYQDLSSPRCLQVPGIPHVT